MFSKFIRSRYFIVALLFIIFTLCIWFLGPIIGLGDWHPLASKFARIFLIIWFLCLAICVSARWTLFPLIIITVTLLIWFVAPLLSFSNSKPFESVTTRVILLGIIFFIALLYGVFCLLKALQKDSKLFEKIFRNKNENNEENVVLSRVSGEFDKKISWTLSQLKVNNQKNKAISRPFKKKNYLYAVPWFLSIGSSGSGKTTALLNSGIQLTDPAQVRSSTAYLSIHEEAPATEECDIWLTHEAVFIDTSGSYTNGENKEKSANWRALLNTLRTHRPKTPINGTIVNISTEDILNNSDADNLKLAANIREQILQVKKELGITFPIYLVVTKADKIIGFKEYFQSLTEDGRLRPWGFSLPVYKEFSNAYSAVNTELTTQAIHQEMTLLNEELEKNLLNRLEEEKDSKNKLALYALPEEFKSLSKQVKIIVNAIFIESSFGLPELNQSLRGMFFVSAAQGDDQIEAIDSTILRRYENIVGQDRQFSAEPVLSGNKSFFISDFFKKMLIPESDLVKPNREWQAKNQLFRFLIQTLILFVFAWFAYSFYTSYEANMQYLNVISSKTSGLENKVNNLYKNFQQNDVPDVLDAAATLPNAPDWDLKKPLMEREYGLYTPDSVIPATNYTYTKLTDNLLLSQLVNRMEAVMQESLLNNDTNAAAEALNVYLMLNDNAEEHYHYKTIKSWVAKDWMDNSAQYNFGGKSSVFEHLNNLFVLDRVVKSPFLKNEELIKEIRRLLETQSSSTRIYNRTKSIVSVSAPKDFTLISIVGSEASTAFRFVSGKNLDYAVSGIYTYDGYHNVFKPKLKAIIAEAILNDKWLMGRGNSETAKTPLVDLSLMDDIKKQYLIDYKETWSAFISDIDAATGDNLAYDINILRVYASPNSPLSRLTQAIVKETTLLQETNQGLMAQVANQASDTTLVSEKTKKAAALAGNQAKGALSQEALLEKTLVDDHFSALREMVTGQADFSNKNNVSASKNTATAPSSGQTMITSADGFNSLINELYMYTSVANTTIITGGIPQSTLLETRVRFEAERLPPPFKRILTTLVSSSATKIKREKETILTLQAQIQFDELMTAFDTQVSTLCKQRISGKYPFDKHSPYEVALDDFSQFFASNGVVDNFFNKYLVKYVEINSTPWKYKTIDAINIQRVLDSPQNTGTVVTTNSSATTNSDEPTLEGEYLKLLTKQGPNPEFFSLANDIKQSYFQDNGQRLLVRYSYNIVEVDPMITELILNFDGNIQRYIHNPFRAQELVWPSAKLTGAEVEIIANPKIRLDTSTVQYEGPWALFKFLDRSKVISSTDSGKSLLELNFEDRKVVLEITSQSSKNPLSVKTANRFRCF